MSRKSVLIDMYNHGVALSKNIEAKNEEYRERVRSREAIEERLIVSLNDEQKKLFEEWREAFFGHELYFDDKNYRQGFYLGVQITSEAFILKD